MKFSEIDSSDIISTGIILLAIILLFLSLHFLSVAGICLSLILLLLALIYSLYRMYENSVGNAKRVAKKFTKEELEEPIKLRDLRGGKLGMKLTMRYGGWVAALAILGIQILFLIPLFLLLFYFMGWPDNYAWLWGMVGVWIFITYISVKSFEEAAVILKEEEWK